MKFTILFKEIFIIIIGNFLYLFSFLIPKNKNLWIFGGLLGEGYNDNSKYFFEHVHHQRTGVKAVWISQNKDVIKSLRKKGYNAWSGFSAKGCWTSMRAGVGVISHSKVRDLKPFVITPKVKFIQLWHGIPLKKIEFDDTVFFNKPSLKTQAGFLIMKIISPGFRRKFDMIIACSNEDQKNFSTAFKTDISKIKVTGYPRNDVLSDRHYGYEDRRGIRQILYVPTFRGIEKSDFNLFDKYGFDVAKLESFLDTKKMELIVKLHPYNLPSPQFLKQIKNSDQIFFYKGSDIYDHLGDFDMIITDYSSIYFDFLLLDRPIIFAPFDIEEYLKNDRNFYYKYDEVSPGPKAFNWDDIINYIDMFISDPHKFSDKRRRLIKQFHHFNDSDASERVYQEIKMIL